VNALIHRDYLVLGSEVHLDVYDDRLSISSPGIMPRNGRLPDNVARDEVESIRRNPVLADLFQRMDFMERRGSGLRKICQATASEGNYETRFLPRFENGNGFFRVTLWDMNYEATSETDQVTPQVTPPSRKPSERACNWRANGHRTHGQPRSKRPKKLP
jgi:ATP-dependent DNA helicase RecG